MSDFDPYLKWLGIRDTERPPNHYRLLGVDTFESDTDIIAAAADQRMGHIRSFQSGPEADLSQKLLNELALARRCLMNPERKQEYDAELKQQAASQQAVAAPPAPQIENEQPAEPAINVLTSAPAISVAPRKKNNSKLLIPAIVVFALILVGSAIGVVAVLNAGKVVADPSNPTGDKDKPGSKDKKPTNDKNSKHSFTASEIIDDGRSPWDVKPEFPKTPPTALASSDTELKKRLHPVYYALCTRQTDMAKQLLTIALQDPKLGDKTELENSDTVKNCRKAIGDLERFWAKYDIALGTVKKDQKIAFRKRLATVESIDVDNKKITLSATDGSSQEFNLSPSDIPRDLATAIFRLKFKSKNEQKFCASFTKFDFQDKRELLGTEFDLSKVLVDYQKLASTNKPPKNGKTKGKKKGLPKTDLKDPNPKNSKNPNGTDTKLPESKFAVKKVEVPDNTQRASAIKQLKKTYSEFYEDKTPIKQGEFVDVLLKDAQEKDIDAVSRYVMFDEARKISIALAHPENTAKCVDMLGKYFELEFYELAKKSLDEVGRKIKMPAKREKLITAWSGFWRKALNEEDFVHAVELIDRTIRAARKLKDVEFLKRMSVIKSDVQGMKNIASKAEKQREVLKENAGDAAANLAEGRYLCFVKNDFAKGIPYLMKGSDSRLKNASELETKILKIAEDQQTADQQLEVAEAWMAVARKDDLVSKRLKLHAAKWFEKAEIQLNGLKKKEVGKILDELDLIKTEFDAGTASAFGTYRFLAEHTWQFDWRGYGRWNNAKFTSDGRLSFMWDGKARTLNWMINRRGNIEIRTTGKFSFVLIPKTPTELVGQRLTIKNRQKGFEVVGQGTIKAVGRTQGQ